MEISKQGLEQRALKKAGKCVSRCGRKAVRGVHCEVCRGIARERNRNAYREKHGIAFEAPLSKRGKRRIE